MSDVVLLAIITIIGQLAVIWLNARNARKLLEKTDAQTNELGPKVDAYHKETNSKLSQLVVVEKALSYKEGEEQGKIQEQEKKAKE